LRNATYPPLGWIVPGVIPEGYGILASSPKVGKSFFALQTTLAVASGQPVFGVPVDQRPTLYLALEDSERRLQYRIRSTKGEWSTNWYCITGEEDFIDQAKKFAIDNPTAFIVIDTMQVARLAMDSHKGNDISYKADYAFARSLKKLTPEHGCLLVTHHTRKMDSDDFIDGLSGSQGLAGGVDYVMTLLRPRLSPNGQLHVSGRDVTEATYSMNFMDGLWSPNGGDLSRAADKAKESQRGEMAYQIAQWVNTRPATLARDVVEKFNIKQDAARQQLSRLHRDGKIGKDGTGVYKPLSRVTHDVFRHVEDGLYV
jgi:RecA-family ATPase